MEVIREAQALTRACQQARASGERVGLVPTMGALHAGHLSLVAEAARRSDMVVVSVFVNPTQFGPGEDLERYPRNLEADAAACDEAGVAVVFAPSNEALYPPGEETRVRVGETARALCGAHRPGHFEGVATVVTKLLNIVGPCVAVFGRKDYQQWRVIQRFVRDLLLPVEVIGAPIVREPDGLALSSRNAYLSTSERQRALAIVRGLSAAIAAFDGGQRSVERLRSTARAIIEPAVSSIDYVELADAESVRPFSSSGRVGDKALMAVAAQLGKTRLIDNVVLGEDEAPAQAE